MAYNTNITCLLLSSFLHYSMFSLKYYFSFSPLDNISINSMTIWYGIFWSSLPRSTPTSLPTRLYGPSSISFNPLSPICFVQVFLEPALEHGRFNRGQILKLVGVLQLGYSNIFCVLIINKTYWKTSFHPCQQVKNLQMYTLRNLICFFFLSISLAEK